MALEEVHERLGLVADALHERRRPLEHDRDRGARPQGAGEAGEGLELGPLDVHLEHVDRRQPDEQVVDGRRLATATIASVSPRRSSASWPMAPTLEAPEKLRRWCSCNVRGARPGGAVPRGDVAVEPVHDHVASQQLGQAGVGFDGHDRSRGRRRAGRRAG